MAYVDKDNEYVWSDGDYLHCSTGDQNISIPMELFDELVLIRFFNLTESEKIEVIERIVNQPETLAITKMKENITTVLDHLEKNYVRKV